MIGTSYLDLERVRLHFGHGGTPGNPSVLLLHGWPDLWFTWEAQMQRLVERGYYAVAPDQRGCGRSSKPERVKDYDLDLLTEDIAQMIERLALAPVHLVGHDWGAAVAWWLAINRPDLVRTLTIVNVPHPAVFLRNLLLNPAQLARSWYMFAFQIPGLADALFGARDAALLTYVLREGAQIHDQALLARYREGFSQPGAVSHPLYWYRALFRVGIRKPPHLLQRRVRVPTQILWGERDPAFASGAAEQSAKMCKHVEVSKFDTGHWPYHEQPQLFADKLLSFLERHTPELRGVTTPSRALH